MTAAPYWTPTPEQVAAANLTPLLRDIGAKDFAAAQQWAAEHPEAFWERTIKTLGIAMRASYSRLLDTSRGVQNPRWLNGATLNIADSCFRASPDAPAIITRRQDGTHTTLSTRQLDLLSNRVANALRTAGLGRGDAIAIDMAMTAEAVALYLGIVKAGCAAISIPDSFPPEEIAKRLDIGKARAVFTQDILTRAGKNLPLYEKICAANAPRTFVLYARPETRTALRPGDMAWEDFLATAADTFTAVGCSPHDTINILFSSGTTGTPKAIPWDHTTPIKAASDGYYHHDIKPGDVVCWPTNLGWMMGPWLLFAALINRATVALYEGVPTERGFCEFVQDVRVTMLGLVPGIVKGWRASSCADGLDWSHIRTFSSSGEASDPNDYRWLMTLNQPPGVIKPVVEYCGGTEIGGGYIANNLITPQNPGAFNGKNIGNDFVVLDETGKPCAPGEIGEVFLIPPSIGLSIRLLNNDNDKVYYAGCPTWNDKVLRRHGDRIIVHDAQHFQSDGRADNTMNLGGIKVGSAEIERVVNRVPGVLETAAIGVPPPEGGPDRLIIYTVAKPDADRAAMKNLMQQAIKELLNPLYRLHEVRFIDALPRTASNKVMHKDLRATYRQQETPSRG
ncbi:MAG: AMP-binding protein [Alphaproteobacteria bacterium]